MITLRVLAVFKLKIFLKLKADFVLSVLLSSL